MKTFLKCKTPLTHQYSRWSDPISTCHGHKQQWRVCVDCHRAKFRTLRWDGQTPVNAVWMALRSVAGKEL